MKDVFTETLNHYVSSVEKYLCNVTEHNDCEQRKVFEAMKYSLLAGGKRLRPVLMLEFYKMCGGRNDILPVACSIEMIHTFSLIHDDMPCMDDDDYRRGILSCHKKFGEATALLAGDALATLPYEVIAKEALNGNISYEKAVKVIECLSCAVGSDGMIGGQEIDIENENKSVSIELLKKFDSLKTGALIKAACVCGCILADVDQEKTELAESYAEKIGLAFQIVDDILDVTGNFETLGKMINSDEKQSKCTFVSLLGLEKSRQTADRLTSDAISILNKFENSEFMITLTEKLLNRKK